MQEDLTPKIWESILGYNIKEDICLGKLIKIYAPLSELDKGEG